MRRATIGALILGGWISLTTCTTRGIIELSRSDTQRCYEMLSQDGQLLTEATSALDDYVANIADQTKVASTRAQCKNHLAAWDRLVRELYEKYGLSEEDYRLDVFRGRFMPLVRKTGE